MKHEKCQMTSDDSHCTQTQASKEDLSKIYIKLTTNRSLKTLSTDRDK